MSDLSAVRKIQTDKNGNPISGIPVSYGDDTALNVVFSERNGAEWITINVSPLTVISRAAEEGDRMRFPMQYEAWVMAKESGSDISIHGTPLTELDFITDDDLHLLSFHHVRSAEQLAALNDLVAQRIGFRARELRTLTRKWLDGRDARAKAEASAEVTTLRSELAEMKAMLMAALQQPQPQPKRRGRPRKAKMEETPVEFLKICTDAAAEIGIDIPTAIVSSTASAEKQLLALVNRTGKELAAEHQWPILEREALLTLADATAEYSLPSDFDRLIRRTSWDRTSHWPLVGPVSPQEWQWRKSSILSISSLHRRYRLKPAASSPHGLKYVIDPTPASSDVGSIVVFEYVSNGWCSNAAGDVFRDAWLADDDVGVLDETLLTLGLIWRFKRATGQAYADDREDYDQSVDVTYAQQLAMDSISLTRHEWVYPDLRYLVPEGNFGP